MAYISVPATRIGLPSGTLQNVERIECDVCGESSTEISSHGYVVKAYRAQLARVGRPLTPAEFAYLRRSLGKSGKEYAKELGVSNVTISRVENGDAVPQLQDVLIRALTLIDIHGEQAIAPLSQREGESVVIDVAQLAKSQPREVGGGWGVIEPTMHGGSNVVVLRKRGSERQIDTFQCEAASNSDDFTPMFAQA